MTELAVGGKRISLCAFNLWLGIRFHMAGYKIVQCSFKCNILISDTEASESTARHALRKCSDPLSAKLQNGFFSSLNFVFLYTCAKQIRSWPDLCLENLFFADLLLKLMTSEKHHILKIELTLTVLYA